MRIKGRHLAMIAIALFDIALVAVVTPLFGVRETANVFTAVLAGKAGLFVWLYGTRSNWRATTGGRAVMGLIACIATICLVGTLGAYFGDYPGRTIVRLTAFIAIGLTIANLLLTLVENQRKSPIDERNEAQ